MNRGVLFEAAVRSVLSVVSIGGMSHADDSDESSPWVKKAFVILKSTGSYHEAHPCYWPRGRFDDGVYVSIEYSTGYKGFKDGLYIVILANGGAEDDNVKAALRHARNIYPDAHVKTTPVYLGCVH
jgi:hypothetical protein